MASGLLAGVTSLLGLGAPKAPDIPVAEVPAPPAPVRRTDTGALITVGSDAVGNQRVSGGRSTTSYARGSDPLGNLGRGSGLNI